MYVDHSLAREKRIKAENACQNNRHRTARLKEKSKWVGIAAQGFLIQETKKSYTQEHPLSIERDAIECAPIGLHNFWALIYSNNKRRLPFLMETAN
jgi:hypothetical protein